MENSNEKQTKKTINLLVFFRNFAVICLVFFIVSLKFVNYKDLYYRVRLKVLNRLRPESITYLVRFSNNPVINAKDEALKKYLFYYQNVQDLMPDRIDALGLTGYLQYYLGKTNKAIKAYEKAIEGNPHFFWFYHNLGAIYFHSKDYDKAIEVLSKGLATRPENVMRFISVSPRIYMPILKGNNPGLEEPKIMNQIRKGYRNSYLMLVLSFQAKKDYESMLKACLKAIEGQLDGAGDFHFYAGLAFYELNKPEEATLFFKKCIDKNPKYAQAIKYLGILSVESGAKELGLRLIAQANLLEKSKDAYVFNLQKIYLQPY